jgi:3-oxoacyl-[acyl-carrier-protein] synthase-3
MSGAQRRSVILGTGSELPAKIITNHDLEKIVDTSDEWITVRTGIKQRRVLEEGKGTTLPFTPPGALDDARMEAKISTPLSWQPAHRLSFPSSACVLEDLLGLGTSFPST